MSGKLYRISADEKLFNAWRVLAEKVDSLKSSVQNDVMVPRDAVALFEEHSATVVKELRILRGKTLRYLFRCTKQKNVTKETTCQRQIIEIDSGREHKSGKPVSG